MGAAMSAAMSQRAERRSAAQDRREQAIVGNMLHRAVDHLPTGTIVHFAARLYPRPWLLQRAAFIVVVTAAVVACTQGESTVGIAAMALVFVAGQVPRWFLVAIVASSDGTALHRCRYTTVGRAVAEVSARDVQHEVNTTCRGRQVSVWTINGKRYATCSAAEEQQVGMILRTCERELSR